MNSLFKMSYNAIGVLQKDYVIKLFLYLFLQIECFYL